MCDEKETGFNCQKIEHNKRYHRDIIAREFSLQELRLFSLYLARINLMEFERVWAHSRRV